MTVRERMWATIEKVDKEFFGKRKGYNLYYDEIDELYECMRKDPFKGICSTFDYGFIKGIRYQKAQEKKKRQAVKV